MIRYSLFLMVFILSCQQNKKVETNPVLIDSTAADKEDTLFTFHESDTAFIKDKQFVISVYKGTHSCFFKVEKKSGASFKTILVDSDYQTNNSTLFFKDMNRDGYLDIVWTKKWQDHSYLFDPRKEIFSEVGEFHDVDTLKVNGSLVYFKNKYPLLYLQNLEKEFEWMTELHSELFVIDDNYKKISFATIDNFASLEDWNIKKATSMKSVVANCYVPPYTPKFGESSIWNSGKSVDSIFMKAKDFDSAYIVNYWKKNYNKLLGYGKEFKVRRATEISYY